MEREEVKVDMSEYISCDLCGNDYGRQRRVDVKNGTPVKHIFICFVCGEGKTDFEIYKLAYYKKGGS